MQLIGYWFSWESDVQNRDAIAPLASLTVALEITQHVIPLTLGRTQMIPDDL